MCITALNNIKLIRFTYTGMQTSRWNLELHGMNDITYLDL